MVTVKLNSAAGYTALHNDSNSEKQLVWLCPKVIVSEAYSLTCYMSLFLDVIPSTLTSFWVKHYFGPRALLASTP